MKASRKSAATAALLGFCLAQGSFVGCGGSFTVGRIEPLLVVMISPSDGATQIPLSANISVTFSHDVNPATLTSTSFYLADSAGDPVTATISYDVATNTATLDPDSDLAFSAQYTIHVTSAVLRASDGAYLAKEVASTLTTVDPPPLEVVGATPSDGSAGVPLDTTIRVTFSEGVDTSTVDTSSFVVEDITDPLNPLAVSGTFSFDSTDAADPLRTDDIVIFTPDSALPYSAAIQVTLTTDIKSARATASGGSLSAQAVWTFQTLDPPPLEVVFTEPADGATDIPVGSDIVVTFSEDVDATSVTATSFVLEDMSVPEIVTGARTVAANIATLDPAAALDLDTPYRVTLTEEIKSLRATTSGGSLSAKYVFEFRTEPLGPLKVESVSPPDGQLSVDPAAVVEVTFNTDVDDTTLTESIFFLNPGAQSDWATRVSAVISYDAGTYTATLDPDVELTGGTDYTVTVTTGVQGVHGETMLAEFISHFRTRVSVEIAYTEPLTDETGVDMDAVVLVVFTSDIDTATVDQASFYVQFQDRWERVQTLPGAFSFSGVDPDTGGSSAFFTTNAVTFTPSPAYWNGMSEARALLYDTMYTATLTNAIQTTGGEDATAVYTWDFTTGSAPVVTGTTPIDGAVEVVVIDPITATFNVAMDPATVTAATFLVEPVSAGAPATGTVSLSPDGLTATFQVTGRLEFATEYRATLVGGTSGMADLDANFLDADYTWTFTTSPANVVDAYEDSASVDTDHVVVAVFSRPVDPETVTSDNFYIIRDPASTAVKISGLISLNDDRRIATFIPSPELEAPYAHTLYATTGIRDWLGNPLEADFTLDFDTTDDTDQVTLSDNLAFGPEGPGQPGDVNILITFDEDAAGGTLNADSLILTDPSSNPVPGTITYVPDTFTVIFDPDVLLQESGDYEFTATNDICDLSGNVYVGSGTAGPGGPAPRTFTFSVETAAPTITDRNPAPDDPEVAADTVVTVTFSEDMDPASFDDATFHVKVGALDIPGTITVEANIATFTPSAWLDAGVTYTVTVAAAVCDLAGNQLGADDVWTFTVDTTAPAVSAVDPADAAGDVAVTTHVTVTFSEKIDPGSVTVDTVSADGNIRVRRPSDGAKVFGLATVSDNVLVFDPAEDLDADTTYVVTVTAGAGAVRDLAGNVVGAAFSSTFTTAP